jgi:hydroxymethylglutaryl-CoA reductase
MLGEPTAAELGRICAAVGLIQNFAALRALSTVGIVKGHMKLKVTIRRMQTWLDWKL